MVDLNINKIIEMYKSMSIEDIENVIGVSGKIISKILLENNVVIRSASESNKLLGKLKKDYKNISWETKKERDKIVCDLYNNTDFGSTIIAKSVGISKKTVLKILDNNNIERDKKYFKEFDIEKAIKLYNEGKSFGYIARKLNVCTQTVDNRLTNLVDKRSPGQTMSSILGREEEVISMYDMGMSSYDIAEELNINNPDTISSFLSKEGLIRSKDEIRVLVAKKLANRDIFKSSLQIKLENILHELDIGFESEYPIDGWNFDIKISNTNKLIEIQGGYWHKLPNRAQRDKKKKEIATNKGYEVFYIWENQFHDFDYLKNLVKYICDKSCINFSFGDIEIKNLKRKESKNLIEKWHYTGKIGNFSVSYGAFYNNEIIAICLFGSITRQGIAKKQNISVNNILELSRFCINPKFHKHNFASWFLSRCIKKVKKDKNIKVLIAFSDPSYNHNGGIYKATNWIYDGCTTPNYWYVKNNRNIVHKKSVWDKAKKENTSEKHYAECNGLKRVIGLPKHRWIYKL